MVKYTTMQGQTFELSIEAEMFGPDLLWRLYEEADERGGKSAELLSELHTFLCSALYGKVERTED